MGKNLVDRSLLDDFTVLHHHDPMTERAHDLQIVGNEEIAQAALVLQFAQEVDDLGLNGQIERRGRLVEQDEFRFERDCPRNSDALALAAGKLVREARQDVVRKPGADKRLLHALQPITFVVAEPIDDQPLLDDLADRHARIERGERILEDDLHARSERPHLVTRPGVDRFAVEEDFAAVGRQELHQRLPERRLAGPGFADQPQRFVPVKL